MLAIQKPEIFRENVRNKLQPIFDDETITINIEKGVYNYAIKEANARKIIKKWENPYFSQLYLDRLRSIYLNLKNEELLNQIKSKEISAQNVAFMSHQEMNSQHWKPMIEEIGRAHV